MHQLMQNLQCQWERSRQSLSDWVKRHCKCRECGKTVNPLEDVCPVCGAGNPVTLAISPGWLVASFLGAAILFVLILT